MRSLSEEQGRDGPCAETQSYRFVAKRRSLAGLWVVNLMTSPEYLWVIWVMGGWGIRVAFSGFRLIQPDLFHGPEWERRQVEKRLGRPL